ncbi:hypothetical protein M3Y99_00587700 [Aphelenchoides fujianensis]|nr:hypothetical protein M3Y99_00587700 [Aphelenchoides fujianensis]
MTTAVDKMELIDEEPPVPLAQMAARVFLNAWLTNPGYERDEQRFTLPVLRAWQRCGLNIVKIDLTTGVGVMIGDQHHVLNVAFITELFERTSFENVGVKWHQIDVQIARDFLAPLIRAQRLKVGRAYVNVQLWHQSPLQDARLPFLAVANLCGIYDLTAISAFLRAAPNVRKLGLSLPHALDVPVMVEVREHVLRVMPELRQLTIKHFYRETQKKDLEKELNWTLTPEHAQVVQQSRFLWNHSIGLTYQLRNLAVNRPAGWPQDDLERRHGGPVGIEPLPLVGLHRDRGFFRHAALRRMINADYVEML